LRKTCWSRNKNMPLDGAAIARVMRYFSIRA
jgi:hypothetical protein